MLSAEQAAKVGPSAGGVSGSGNSHQSASLARSFDGVGAADVVTGRRRALRCCKTTSARPIATTAAEGARVFGSRARTGFGDDKCLHARSFAQQIPNSNGEERLRARLNLVQSDFAFPRCAIFRGRPSAHLCALARATILSLPKVGVSGDFPAMGLRQTRAEIWVAWQ